MINQKGFSLIEVLIALLVTSVGLLGLAALQAKSLQYNHGAYLRSQANILAYDIADRMRLNRDVARTNGYNIALGESAPTGSGRVEVDQAEWLALLARILPSGDGAISCASRVCSITIKWRDAADNGDQQFIYRTQI